jgi:hypothetical protein
MTSALTHPKMAVDQTNTAHNAYEARAMTSLLPSRQPARTRDETDTIRLRERLMRETGCTEAEVGLAVRLALERFREAPIQEFVTLLAERDARRRLREAGAGHVRHD